MNEERMNVDVHPVVRPSVRVGRLVHGFDDPEHKAVVREIMREVREMEEALEWIIAPDRPVGSDAEMVYVMEQTARKILKANEERTPTP